MSDVRAPGTSPGTAQDASLGELFGRLTSDLGILVRDEVQLAKVELKQDIRDAGKPAGMFGAAAIAAWMTVVLVSFAAAWGLAEVMPAGVAFLIVAVLWGVAAALLYARGRRELETLDLRPEATIETIQEDVQWARKQRP